MKHDDLHSLDQLLKSRLDQYSKEAPDLSWKNFGPKIAKKAFWNFGWKHFNFFYAGLILLHACVTAGIGFHYYTFVKNHHFYKEKDTLSSNKGTPIVKDTLLGSMPIQKKQTSPKKPSAKTSVTRKPKSPMRKPNTTGSTKKELPPPILTKEDVPTVVETLPQVVIPKKKKKVIVTIVEQDTIIKYDTVKVKKSNRIR